MKTCCMKYVPYEAEKKVLMVCWEFINIKLIIQEQYS